MRTPRGQRSKPSRTSATNGAVLAYEDPATGNPTRSDMRPLPEALVALAALSPVRLTSAKEDRKRQLEARTQSFFKERLADFTHRAQHPLILVDADTCRTVWPWLQDERLDPRNVQLAEGFNAQTTWPAARLVRVRTNNSPKVLWDIDFVEQGDGQAPPLCYRAPKWADAQLFKLTDTINTNV